MALEDEEPERFPEFATRFSNCPSAALIRMVIGAIDVIRESQKDESKRGRVIVNMNDVGTQIGAAPAPGTHAERLVVAMQRLNARRVRRDQPALRPSQRQLCGAGIPAFGPPRSLFTQ